MASSGGKTDIEDPRERRVAGLKRHARNRRESAREAIRKAASRLFRRNGYSDVTLDLLASQAGVTRQTLYRHFRSKYEIALDYMAESNAKALQVWKSLEEHDLDDRESVLAWVRSVIDFSVSRENFRAYVELTSTEPAYRAVLAGQIGQIIVSLSQAHRFFADAAANPGGLESAEAHLFIATLMERSDFIAIGEEWFSREHLEQIMTDWLMRLAGRSILPQ